MWTVRPVCSPCGKLPRSLARARAAKSAARTPAGCKASGGGLP